MGTASGRYVVYWLRWKKEHCRLRGYESWEDLPYSLFPIVRTQLNTGVCTVADPWLDEVLHNCHFSMYFLHHIRFPVAYISDIGWGKVFFHVLLSFVRSPVAHEPKDCRLHDFLTSDCFFLPVKQQRGTQPQLSGYYMDVNNFQWPRRFFLQKSSWRP